MTTENNKEQFVKPSYIDLLNNPDYYHHIEATTNKKLKVQLYRTITVVGSTLGMAAFYRDMHDFLRRYRPNATVIQWSMPVYSKAPLTCPYKRYHFSS